MLLDDWLVFATINLFAVRIFWFDAVNIFWATSFFSSAGLEPLTSNSTREISDHSTIRTELKANLLFLRTLGFKICFRFKQGPALCAASTRQLCNVAPQLALNYKQGSFDISAPPHCKNSFAPSLPPSSRSSLLCLFPGFEDCNKQNRCLLSYFIWDLYWKSVNSFSFGSRALRGAPFKLTDGFPLGIKYVFLFGKLEKRRKKKKREEERKQD